MGRGRYMNPEYLADDIEFIDENIISGGYVPPGCKDDEFAQLTKLSGRGRFSLSDSCHVLSRYLPVRCTPSVVNKMKSRAYVSQFSDDGSLFVAGFQKSHITIYDVDRGWKIHKDIRAWSLKNITDTCLSPNHRFLIYSSISPIVHSVDVGSATKDSHANVAEIHEGLELSSSDDDYHHYSLGIFSVKCSTDGREIVAASSDDAIYVYDLEAKKLSLRIEAHRVWDRRCLSTDGKAAGVLMGHLEGITFIDTPWRWSLLHLKWKRSIYQTLGYKEDDI
ncbi:hypothetical protein SASPL_109199 [Salvia splendens]|uniref:LEC14B protein n=1 Tax=Salvia splendens TaxID=180675 RepID=A0A8X8YGP3_SALSN|nr:hypothetical protein SASPL_109199 [Salvia splendens]